MRRLLLPVVVILSALGAAALGGGPARAAAGQVVTGVWWRAQTDGGTLPAPPPVSSHQLWVSSDPSGPSAISAIHLDILPTEVASSLTLHVANLTAAPATPAAPMQAPVLVCPTTSVWKAADAATPGAWNSHPTYDCAKGQVQGSLSADQKTLVFDLTSIATPGGAFDVAVVPGLATSPVPAPPVPLPVTPPSTPVSGNASPTFDVTFAPPALADVVVSPVAPEDVGDSTAPAESVSDLAPAPAASSSVADLLSPAAPFGATPGASQPLGPPLVNLDRPTVRPAALAANTRAGTRLLAGLVFAALMAWAWLQLSVESRAATAPTVGRARMTLYDVPPAPAARVTARHFARTERTGRPPPLR